MLETHDPNGPGAILYNKVGLFGPPGIGKSTIIQRLVERQYNALDLEDIWGMGVAKNEEFVQILGKLVTNDTHLFLGAAGLRVEILVENGFSPVLLYMEEKKWDGRRRRRDKERPEKADQIAPSPDDFLKGYDGWLVLPVEGSVDAVVDKLIWLSFGVPSLAMRRAQQLTADEVADMTNRLSLIHI